MPKLFKNNFTIVTFDNVISKIVNAGYFFLLAIIIDKDDLGTYSWLIAIIAVFTGILTLGIGKVISRRLAVNPELFPHINNSFISLYLGLFTIPLLITGVIYIFFSNEGFSLYWILGGVHAFTSVFLLIFRESFIGLERFLENSKATIFNISSKLFIGLTGIFFFKDVVLVLILALISSNIITFLYYYNVCRKEISSFLNFEINKKVVRSILKEGIPLVGIILFDSALSQFDIILLGGISSMEATGDYNVAYKIYQLNWMPFIILGTVIFPKVSRYCVSLTSFKQKGDQILKVGKGISFLSLYFPLLICLLWTPILTFFSNGKYGSSNQVIIELLCLALPFVSIIGLQWNILIALRKGKTIFVITFITAIVNIGLNSVLIDYYGAIGAALTNLFSNFLQVVLYVYFISKISNNFKELLFYAVRIAIIVPFLYYLLAYTNLWYLVKIIVFGGITIATISKFLRTYKLINNF